ncbi:hypothetical protein PAXINDRAFT_181327 [Paxillus involutus ATCC 200175]|uniref:Uncharacterized protein n=1 Tax=Paxillus involutus ATCC 200175 TaxID=664439 RepID=A0A0C9SVC0_PAXIN|nr:hypothetical protein PAXINDRAFT_181327 [Paxillus involutus ATCC 200175]
MALHCSTQTSTVHAPVCFGDKDDASLRPILVTVYFPGSFPRHLVKNDIPIQISVSVAEELSSFTTPIIGEVVEDSCLSQLSDDHSDSQSSNPPDDIPIPFLPLPSHFDASDIKHWAGLCSDIQRWLLSVPEQSQQWSWGCDIFWLAFIAANPNFPNGGWPIWSPRIILKGPIIESWLEGSLKRLIAEDGKEGQLHRWLWGEFCQQAQLFFPYSLIAA